MNTMTEAFIFSSPRARAAGVPAHGLPRRSAPRNDDLSSSRGRASGRGEPPGIRAFQLRTFRVDLMDCHVAPLLAMTIYRLREPALRAWRTTGDMCVSTADVPCRSHGLPCRSAPRNDAVYPTAPCAFNAAISCALNPKSFITSLVCSPASGGGRPSSGLVRLKRGVGAT